MKKHWSEYTKAQQKFWLNWAKVEKMTLSSNEHEALTFAEKANAMLRKQGYDRNDIPSLILEDLKQLGVTEFVHGRRKRRIGVSETKENINTTWLQLLVRIHNTLGAGKEYHLNTIYAEYEKQVKNKPRTWRDAIRYQHQQGRNRGLFENPRRSVWKLVTDSPKHPNPAGSGEQIIPASKVADTFAQ